MPSEPAHCASAWSFGASRDAFAEPPAPTTDLGRNDHDNEHNRQELDFTEGEFTEHGKGPFQRKPESATYSTGLASLQPFASSPLAWVVARAGLGQDIAAALIARNPNCRAVDLAALPTALSTGPLPVAIVAILHSADDAFVLQRSASQFAGCAMVYCADAALLTGPALEPPGAVFELPAEPERIADHVAALLLRRTPVPRPPPLEHTSPPPTANGLSEDLTKLLADARAAAGHRLPESVSPAAEVELLLPAELLVGLDEPLGGASPTVMPRPLPPAARDEHTQAKSEIPPSRGRLTWVQPPVLSGLPEPGVTVRPASMPVEQPLAARRGAATKILAEAIISRVSATIEVRSGSNLGWVRLREGDILTAVSDTAELSLPHMLVERGIIDRGLADSLAGRSPAWGRHAGAALVARGLLAADELWPMLRSHAEWTLQALLRPPDAIAEVAAGEGLDRIAQEPSVFGGSTGAEVFVDACAAATNLAQQPIVSSFRWGTNAGLLNECAFSPADLETLQKLLIMPPSQWPDAERWAPICRALTLLGILATTETIEPPSSRAPEGLSDDAIRKRVEAKWALVVEGDYFRILGVARDASPPEIRKAYLWAHKAFQPERLLTPSTLDLEEKLREILSLLEEAYAILGPSDQRERYRSALLELEQGT